MQRLRKPGPEAAALRAIELDENLAAAPRIAANQIDKAMDWIEKGFESHDPQMVYLTTPAQMFEPLFGDPRFIAICQKMNLPFPE